MKKKYWKILSPTSKRVLTKSGPQFVNTKTKAKQSAKEANAFLRLSGRSSRIGYYKKGKRYTFYKR
jgi:hypothetical protein